MCLNVKYRRGFLLSRAFTFPALSQCAGSPWQPPRGLSGSVSLLSLFPQQSLNSCAGEDTPDLVLGEVEPELFFEGPESLSYPRCILYSNRSFPSLITLRIETTL